MRLCAKLNWFLQLFGQWRLYMESQEGRSPPARVIGLLCLNDESVDYSRPTPMSNGCHLSVPFNQ